MGREEVEKEGWRREALNHLFNHGNGLSGAQQIFQGDISAVSGVLAKRRKMFYKK